MEVRVRRSGVEDAPAIRRVAFQTGFFGDSMSSLLDDPDRFEPSLDCYLRSGASTAFVAECDGELQGYAISSLRDIRLCSALAIAAGMAAAVLRWPWLSSRDRRWIRSRLVMALRAPFSDERRFRTPAGPRLHINVAERFRGTGAGSRLMEQLLADLRARGCERVHANSYQTARHATESFWRKHGFDEYSRVRTGAWRPFTDDEVSLVCWSRRL